MRIGGHFRLSWNSSFLLCSSVFSSARAIQHPLFRPAPPTTCAIPSVSQSLSTLAVTTPTDMTRAAAIALSHGGGPMPLMGDPTHKDIVKSLRTRVPELLHLNTTKAPRAIVLVTAHWSERVPTISSASKHPLYYDYSGFPPETYQIKYDAPGSPEVAEEVRQALEDAGLKPEMDEERGWDHGVFVPMKLINPAANVPIVQLSVLASESPSDHFAMGQALSSLRDKNIAIVGSGFASFHNIRLLFSGMTSNPSFMSRNKEWNKALTGVVETKSTADRLKGFEDWRNLPNAYESHPRGGAEHFMPLIVAAGAGGESKAKWYVDDWSGLDIYSYYWDD